MVIFKKYISFVLLWVITNMELGLLKEMMFCMLLFTYKNDKH